MELSKYIDHTLLKADAQEADIINLCQEAKKYNFKSVCINPTFIELAKNELEGSEVLVCTVIGFPLGANTLESKVFEANDAILKGAKEVDMVINLSMAKEGRWKAIEDEIRAVVDTVQGSAIVKVIIETCLLTDEEKVEASKVILNAGADFVKTSTGFSTGGATIGDVKLIRQTIGPELGLKASGGVRNRQDALDMINAGATRIGASKGIQIVTGE